MVVRRRRSIRPSCSPFKDGNAVHDTLSAPRGFFIKKKLFFGLKFKSGECCIHQRLKDSNLNPASYKSLEALNVPVKPPSSSLYPLNIHFLRQTASFSHTCCRPITEGRFRPTSGYLQGGGGVLSARPPCHPPWPPRASGTAGPPPTQGPLLSERRETEAVWFVASPGRSPALWR